MISILTMVRFAFLQTTGDSTGALEDSIEVTEDVASTVHQPHVTGLHRVFEILLPTFRPHLRPIFFATVGFFNSITQMFTGRLLWRGLVYSVLGNFKLVCCL